MFKLHYCFNGQPVVKQVMTYQKTKKSEDFEPLVKYYNEFMDVWYAQLEDYLDRDAFNSEFYFRLFKAVESFSSKEADSNSHKKGLDNLGNFNRWFYKILMNWKSNVKTSSVRLKKCPGVNCPVCGKLVGKIDEEHLKHYKTVSDLPKFMIWKGNIYEVFSLPKTHTVTWGKKSNQKFHDLQRGETKIYLSERKKADWPDDWRLSDGKRGVLCPFTKRIVSKIDDDYIRTLPDKYNRYAESMSWHDFVVKHPTALIRSELFSTDKTVDKNEKKITDSIYTNNRIISDEIMPILDYDKIQNGNVSPDFEFVFSSIDKCIDDSVDASILKLIAAGYTVDDVCETLSMEKKDLRTRIRNIRSADTGLKNMLIS